MPRRTVRRMVRPRRSRRSPILFLILLIAIAAFLHFSDVSIGDIVDRITPPEVTTPSTPPDTASPPVSSSQLTRATVERVIDGDTIVLTTGERVRFIGVDAPEIGEPGADEATQFVRDLIDGQVIWLESDGNDTDRFDRLRRYIWIQEPTDTRDESQIRRYMLNALLLEYGHAEVAIFGVVRNEALFIRIAEEAVLGAAA